MSQQLKSQLQAAGMEEDSAYYIGRYTVQGLQYGCLAATPLYLVSAIRGRGFSLRGLARANWLIPSVGAAAGSVAGYAATSQLSHPDLSARTSGLRLNSNRVRQDDLHLIGSVLGALVLPALFLSRVGLINGLLGGAGLGGAAGLVTHQVQRLGKGEDVTGKIEAEAKGAWEEAKSKAKEVKGEVENRL
ncbi:hypothetical protein PSEUBRA_002114 [Kalmanozyma brasiliensis GHG001]|uniref:Uncharacterized protein n=1 Tax=Kalmanozyma brasiliensis (strain GHG001) TaxID=1365824 RepID=V5GQY6_KALBG|nr:uncharacterized protein PSEUBRA_002114 [Kalmanozyma brasiliensis GHG001]EST08357.1 hypothetical protein PSEUBRA_002114 [Kalmanozyma brasiliensis GHG001]